MFIHKSNPRELHGGTVFFLKNFDFQKMTKKIWKKRSKFSKSYFWIFERCQLNDGQIQACNQILVNLSLLEHLSKLS